MTKTEIIPQVDFLSKDARAFLKASLAPNTLRAYAAQLKAWEAHSLREAGRRALSSLTGGRRELDR